MRLWKGSLEKAKFGIYLLSACLNIIVNAHADHACTAPVIAVGIFSVPSVVEFAITKVLFSSNRLLS